VSDEKDTDHETDDDHGFQMIRVRVRVSGSNFFTQR
jgi:hypothetical protein